MNRRDAEDMLRMVKRLQEAGISTDDCWSLRRISMTLHRWHELECGDGNEYGSWTIARGRKERRHGEHSGGNGAHYVFVHDDDGKPFLEHHHYQHGRGKDTVTYTAMADRERGAIKRLKAIMRRYPDLASYIQGDPRGCALYILRNSDIAEGMDVSSCYNRGIAVHR